jgi:tRNA pseudouridine38-40 synthase
MRTLALSIRYDGTKYSGWQVQKNAPTVQQYIENAIEKISGKRYNSVAAGRTDAGVHALGQVVSIDLKDEFNIPENKILYALNTRLPFDIQINAARIFDCKFHARFDAQFREYKYYLSNKYNVFDRYYCAYIKFPFEKELLFESAEIFKVKTDFTTFSKFNPDNNNPICNVVESKWIQVEENKFVYTVKSNHFLYGMVRSVVGAMVEIARNKRNLDDVIKSLYLKDRNLNSSLVKPNGLFLNKVYYKEEIFDK